MLVIFAATLPLLVAAAPACAAVVNGFADQGIGRTPPAKDAWGTNAHAIATALSGKVQFARYNLAWDFANLPSSDPRRGDFESWLSAVRAQGLTPLVSFGADGTNPSAASYVAAAQAFRAQHPDVTEFTAWNEPNNSNTSASASQAAGYFKALTDVCAGSCTVAAGDFAGSRTPGSYYADYKAAVNALGLTPTLWAYHPYEVVNNSGSDRFDGIQRFWSTVGAANASVNVWFTEVGAFKCIHGLDSGTAGQDAAARRLNDLLADPRYGKTARVYYYHLANGADCDWDTGLIDSAGAARPALRTLFPELGAPDVQVTTPSALMEQQATLNGSVDPHWLRTTYRFEYGPTTAYGSVAPISEGDISGGTGAQPVTAIVNGLLAATTYHYRLVATNALGSSSTGDQTFTTGLMPKPAVVVKANGEKFVVYRALNGQLQVWHWNGLTWSSQAFGYAGTVAGNPSAVLAADGRVYVLYRMPNGQLGRFWTDGTNWNFEAAHLYAGTVAGDPSAIALPNGRVEVAYTATNGQLGTFWYLGTDWDGVTYGYADTVAGSPSAVAGPNGRMFVLYRMANGQIGRFWTDFVNWNFEAAHLYAGTVAGDPSAAALPNGRIEVVYRAANAQLGRFWYQDPDWGGDSYLYANSVSGRPSATTESNGRIDVAYRSTDGRLGTFWYLDPNWNPVTFSSAVASHPAAVIDSDGSEKVFYAQPDGTYIYATIDNAAMTATFTSLG